MGITKVNKKYYITPSGIRKAKTKLLFTAFNPKMSWESCVMLRFLTKQGDTGATATQLVNSVIREDKRYKQFRQSWFSSDINTLIRRGYAKKG